VDDASLCLLFTHLKLLEIKLLLYIGVNGYSWGCFVSLCYLCLCSLLAWEEWWTIGRCQITVTGRGVKV